MRTQYIFNSDGLLQSMENDGSTWTTPSGAVPFAYTTGYSYDAVGRLTNIDGPLAGADDATQFTFWSSADVLKDGYAHEIKRKVDSTNFLTTTLDAYDYFGNAGTTIDPDLTPTCRTWDGNRNYLSQVREAMAGQADCVTPNAADITTSYVRDSRLRLTKTTRPLGDCQHKEYDTWGRLTNTKLRDDCVAANTGNTMVQSYDSNGLLIKTELQDSASVVTRRLQGTYLDGGQVDSVINPVAPTYSRNFTYNVDGQRDFTTFENGLGKTEQFWDAENRETSRARYESALVHDDWTFHYPNSDGNPTRKFETVTDPASKVVTTTLDDMGRKNKVVSPDSGTTLYVYDAASRLVTLNEAGTVHTFTYDNIGRKLTEDYGSELCAGTNPVDVQYVYDALPLGGPGCPAGATCTNLSGRLAKVTQYLLCAAPPINALNQETFYGYDAAGRLISEEIDDPSPRAVQQNYSWDKNGNLTQVTAPSGASMTYTLGGAGNSDANLITSVARTVGGSPTNLVTGVLWAPFGPVTQYDQANTIGGNAIRATFSWNLAYRATQIKYAATGANRTQIDYTEDEKGRYTQKLYSNVAAGVQSDYLQYDWFDRPTCDATISGACPTSGTNLKTSVSYNSSNDRAAFHHQDASFGDIGYSVGYNAGTDQISSLTYSGATNSFGWDARGNRTFEDNGGSSFDRRDYTYDGRRRVRTITGQFPRFNVRTGWSWHAYTITYAYDHRDHVVFRSWRDTTAGGESQTFYYWDVDDRLTEIKFVPSVTSPLNYTIYDFYWLGRRPVAFWAVDQAGTASRNFTHADETNRALEVFSWPTTGDAAGVWSETPEIFGWDRVVLGSGFFQPLALNGALYDDGTTAYLSVSVPDRPWLLIDHGVHFDPLTESFLQRVGSWPGEPYALSTHTPQRGIVQTRSLQLAVPSRCSRLCPSCASGGSQASSMELLVDGTTVGDVGVSGDIVARMNNGAFWRSHAGAGVVECIPANPAGCDKCRTDCVRELAEMALRCLLLNKDCDLWGYALAECYASCVWECACN